MKALLGAIFVISQPIFIELFCLKVLDEATIIIKSKMEIRQRVVEENEQSLKNTSSPAKFMFEKLQVENKLNCSSLLKGVVYKGTTVCVIPSKNVEDIHQKQLLCLPALSSTTHRLFHC